MKLRCLFWILIFAFSSEILLAQTPNQPLLLIVNAENEKKSESGSNSNLPFIVIVNPKNESSTIDKKTLSEIFLKKTTRWQTNNETILPVELVSKSEIR